MAKKNVKNIFTVGWVCIGVIGLIRYNDSGRWKNEQNNMSEESIVYTILYIKNYKTMSPVKNDMLNK